MMTPIEIVLRLLLGAVLFFFFVWDWSWRLYITNAVLEAEDPIREHFQLMSLFIGNTAPTELVVDLFLMSRGFFGLTLVTAAVWRVPESLLVTSEKRYTADLCIITFAFCVAVFIVGLLVHAYNIGLLTASGNLG